MTRHIDDDQIVFGEVVECFGKEVEVLKQEFEAVDKTAVRAESHLVHDIFKRDEFFDVKVGFVSEFFGGRVEVDVEVRTAGGLEMGYEGGAEGGLERFKN